MLKQIFCIRLTGIIFCGLLFVNCTFQTNNSTHMYTDPQYGFQITTPDSGWLLTDETGIPEVLLIIKSGTRTQNFIPNVTVAIEALTCMMTAAEYGKRNQEFLTAQGY